jgi:serine/threonine protein kinase
MILAALTGGELGNYRVLEKIGQGGMGVVYLGEHRLIGRKVAIKVLLPQVASDQTRLRRFFNEARASAQVRHPSIVDVLDFGTHGDTSYLVMEYLEGETVRSRLLRTGAMTETTVRRLGRQVASALAAAHARQIIHRDLKPDNLFLVTDLDVIGKQRIKVLDFGIAKLLADSGDGVVDTGGAILGSPGYMAPEQAGAHAVVDERADVYALGCVLFEMLCARRPFTASGLAGVLSLQMFSPAPSPREHAPDISEELDAIVVRMLAKDPSGRFASMDEVVAALGDHADVRAPALGPAGTPEVPRERAALPRRANLLDEMLNGSATGTAGTPSRSRSRTHVRLATAALLVILGAALTVMLRSSATSERATQAPAGAKVDGSSLPPLLAPLAPVDSPQAAPAAAPPPDAGLSRPDAAAAPPPAPPARRRIPHKRPPRPEVKRGQVIDE